MTMTKEKTKLTDRELSERITADPDRPLNMSDFSQWIGKHPRTVARMMDDGLPHISIGRPMFHIPSVVAWFKKSQKTIGN